MKKYFSFILILISLNVFSQTKNIVAIKGIVYISSSRSEGVVNGKTYNEPQQVFKYQTIYFDNDTTQVSAKTDSLGVYSIELKPGTYNVYQEQGLKSSKKGTMIFGSYGLKVTVAGNGYDIYFKNTVNGRSAMVNKGTGTPSKQNTAKKVN